MCQERNTKRERKGREGRQRQPVACSVRVSGGKAGGRHTIQEETGRASHDHGVDGARCGRDLCECEWRGESVCRRGKESREIVCRRLRDMRQVVSY